MSWRDGFEPVRDGAFLQRRGPAYEAIDRDRKLCLFSCDQDLIGSILTELCGRPDCAVVKVSTRSRAGMFLGRAFFDRPDTVGEVWAAYKTHPRMYCCVQDDRFTAPWRKHISRWNGEPRPG